MLKARKSTIKGPIPSISTFRRRAKGLSAALDLIKELRPVDYYKNYDSPQAQQFRKSLAAIRSIWHEAYYNLEIATKFWKENRRNVRAGSKNA